MTNFRGGYEAGLGPIGPPPSSVTKPKADVTTEKIADWLQSLAYDRFKIHGPYDARGAALWDASAALFEGRGPR